MLMKNSRVLPLADPSWNGTGLVETKKNVTRLNTCHENNDGIARRFV